MKKVLLVGSSYSSLKILEFLKKSGFIVYVCGNIRNDPCHNFSDKSIFVDYSKQQFEKHLNNLSFDYIIPSFNDAAYMKNCRFAEKNNLPGFDSYKIAEKISNQLVSLLIDPYLKKDDIFFICQNIKIFYKSQKKYL